MRLKIRKKFKWNNLALAFAIPFVGFCLVLLFGGYQPFAFDTTEHLREENTLVVRVADRLDEKILPYGRTFLFSIYFFTADVDKKP